MGMYASVRFEKTDEGIKQMAIFIAELVKQGVTHKAVDMCASWDIELTGGY